jgi:hypothetical protein
LLLAFSSGLFSAGQPLGIGSGAPSLAPASASPYSLFGTRNALPTDSVSQSRVVNTSEALVGELKYDHFENVTGDIVANLTSIGGYVTSSSLMYNGTTWYGIYSINVPSSDATQFLFEVTNLVNANGKTESVQIQTQDVTNQTGGNQSKVPYSFFSITLQEEANESPVATNHLSGLFGSIGSLLGIVLADAAYVALIAVPIYLLVLGGVLFSGRVLYPMFLRVSKSSSAKRANQAASSIP